MGYIDSSRVDPYALRLKKGRFSKVMVICVTAALLLFTLAVFAVALAGAYVPDALIYCFFGAALGEYWALAFVKKSKTEKEAEQNALYRLDGADAEAEAAGAGGTEADPALPVG